MEKIATLIFGLCVTLGKNEFCILQSNDPNVIAQRGPSGDEAATGGDSDDRARKRAPSDAWGPIDS